MRSYTRNECSYIKSRFASAVAWNWSLWIKDEKRIEWDHVKSWENRVWPLFCNVLSSHWKWSFRMSPLAVACNATQWFYPWPRWPCWNTVAIAALAGLLVFVGVWPSKRLAVAAFAAEIRMNQEVSVATLWCIWLNNLVGDYRGRRQQGTIHGGAAWLALHLEIYFPQKRARQTHAHARKDTQAFREMTKDKRQQRRATRKARRSRGETHTSAEVAPQWVTLIFIGELTKTRWCLLLQMSGEWKAANWFAQPSATWIS